MKSLLISLGTVLTVISTGSLLVTNVDQANNLVIKENSNNQITQPLKINLKKINKNFVRAVYQPNNPRASFHYLDITERIIKKDLTKSKITLKKINFDHRQTEIHTKDFAFLSTDSLVFESANLGDPSYWDDQAFYEHTTILYSDTITEGVTRYNAQLAVGLTKDTNTGKIFFVWGVYGHVVLGSKQAIVSSQVNSVVIKY